MNKTELLILNGSPGSGKSTLADAVAEQLREASVVHAVIDLDELARVYPEGDGSSLKWKNLAAIWPNYTATHGIKVIVPVVIDTTEDLKAIKSAAPTDVFTVCELTAPLDVLKERVTSREPNDYWQGKLRRLVENYDGRSDNEKFRDFRIVTYNKSVEKTAEEIIKKLGWLNYP